jgi:DNA polymerase III sliding clamp (beta) subunit (PCNA family)
MKVNKTELLGVLTAIKPALSKGVLEQGNNFIFTGKEIITYNDCIAISHPFKSDFKCSVPADKFYKLVSRIKKDEFEIQFQKDRLKVASPGVKGNLSTIETDTEVINLIKPSNVDIEWSRLPDNFRKAVGMCLFSMSKDSMKPEMNCVSVNHDHVASTDNMRLSQYTLKEAMEFNFLLPGPAAKEVIKFDVVWYYLADAWIYFSTEDGVIFCSRYGGGKFPDFSHLIALKGKKIFLPKDLSKVIETAGIMTAEDYDIDKRIEVRIKNEKIFCRGEDDTGWIEASTRIKCSQQISFVINPVFFTQILDKTTVLIYNKNESRLLFKSGAFKHIISIKE